MPYKSEHSCRIRPPADFEADSFRRINREADGKPIAMIIGKLKGESTTTLQSFRYPKADWAREDAKLHCERNDGIAFEAATEEAMKQVPDMEKRLRAADLQSLHDYKAGKAEAPTLYKALGYIKAAAEGSPLVFVASEESEDRMGDVIASEGWDLKQFERNPVLMFIHDYRLAPIGTVPKVWVEGKQLLNSVKFDEQDPLGAFIKGKYERGIMRAESVGFRAIEWEEQGNGIHFLKQELLEISAVPVPAHPAALRKMMDDRRFIMAVPELVLATEVHVKVDMAGMAEMVGKIREHMAEMETLVDEMMAMVGEEDGKTGEAGLSEADAEAVKQAILKFKEM